MGSVTKRLVAVMISSSSPRSRRRAQSLEMVRIVLGQRPEAEGQELHDVQLPGLVFLVEALVLPFVVFAVHHPPFGQETAPEIVAVAGEQGVVEIEDGQWHVCGSCGC